jgi:hypothetical protein
MLTAHYQYQYQKSDFFKKSDFSLTVVDQRVGTLSLLGNALLSLIVGRIAMRPYRLTQNLNQTTPQTMTQTPVGSDTPSPDTARYSASEYYPDRNC